MLKVSVRTFLTLAAVVAIMVAPVANAQESDLYTTVASSANPGNAGENVDYTVVYGNIGPNDAIAPLLNLYIPPNQPADLQDYIDGDQDAIDLIDGVLGASITVTHGDVGFFFASTCEGLLIQVDIDADLSGFGAGDTGELTYTLPMPTMPPANPTVAVDGYSEGLTFGRGTCDDCEDMAGTCFGPRVSAVDAITAQIEVVNDGTGEATDACEPLSGFTAGNIAWVDRGECNFDLKAANAQQAGASGIIIGQNVGDDRLGPDGILDPACVDFCGLITIPVAFVSMNDNVAVQAMVAAGETMGTIGAVEATALTTWAHMWENDANGSDVDQDNDDWFEVTEVNFGATGDVPVAAFSYDPEFPFVFQSVTFTDMSTGDPAITAWAWDFGNGDTSTDASPVYSYETMGTYTVSLTVTNDIGSDTAEMDVQVFPLDGPLVGDKVFIPAAAAAAGSGGSFWSTTVEINNRGNGTMSYRIAWLDRDTDNSSPTVVGAFTLGAGMSARYDNIVGDLFGDDLAGGLVFLVDPIDNAVLTSRTFNTFDDGNLAGTFGQAIPAVKDDELITENTMVRFIQLSEDDNFRTNIGFANGTGENIRIMAEFFLADGTSLGTDFIDLAAYSVSQWNSAFGNVTDDMVADGYVDVWTETPGGMFTSYASVVGNDSFNDPTTVLAQ